MHYIIAFCTSLGCFNWVEFCGIFVLIAFNCVLTVVLTTNNNSTY